MKQLRSGRRILAALSLGVGVVFLGASGALLGACGPFIDILDAGFCPFVLEIFSMGITTGTTATTYSPQDSVTRLQMAAFLSRSTDRMLQRHSRRAVFNRFWMPQNDSVLGLTTVGASPNQVKLDTANLWVANNGSGTVSRVRASDGRLLETWTGAAGASGVLTAMGRVFVTGQSNPGTLYMIDPLTPAGPVTLLSNTLGANPDGITFDGARVWTANGSGSVSIATPAATIPWTVTTVATGASSLSGALYDGANVWVADNAAGTLLKLDGVGAVLQTVTVGAQPLYAVFDGANIWVPNKASGTVTVVRASNGTVLQTLTGNGLVAPTAAAFDSERILITNGVGDSVSLWKAANLTALGSVSTGAGTHPLGACSDGLNFWIALSGTGALARF
jgi:hypothetical protein